MRALVLVAVVCLGAFGLWWGYLRADVPVVARLACVGDSNTSGLPGIPSWCDRLGLGPTVGVVNLGEPAALAMRVMADAMDGADQVGEAAVAQADVVVIALGGNDALRAPQFGWEPETIVARLGVLVAMAETRGMRVLLATLPPDGWLPDVQPRVDAVNARLRATVSAERLIDFDTGFDALFLPDRLHLTAVGQELRAARVRVVLGW